MDKLEDGTHLVNAVPDPQTILDLLQLDLVELEAFTHTARGLVNGLPRVPWPDDGQELRARLNYDRMLAAVADAARRARLACHDRLRELAAATRT